MRGLVNDALRRLVGFSIVALGFWLDVVQRWRIRAYRFTQARLRVRYGISDSTPVLSFGPEQQATIAERAKRERGPIRYAETSGSTDAPKKLLYPLKRIARAKWAFIDAFARAFARTPWRRHSLYVFSSLHEDGSLTALMLAEKALPSYLATLQAPDRLQSQPALRDLAGRYGDAALRLWVLCLANPGVLYSTNPSTLSTFLDTMRAEWTTFTALIRDFALHPEMFQRSVHHLAGRLTSRGAASRLRSVAESATPLPLSLVAPAVHTYVCWTGGYVQPFLSRLAQLLPAPWYRLLPMYSMSTETPETTPCYRGDSVAFLPLAQGVLFEFLPDGADDDAARLVLPHALEASHPYTLVVSDAYGLRRYQTDDLFLCVGFVSGLPDLRFVRRRSLSYSFTGEKLTGEQVSIALDRLRNDFASLGDESFLTCMPSSPGAGALPHYRLVRIERPGTSGTVSMDAAALRCDVLIGEINREYRVKREGGRLGPMRGATVSQEDFLARIGAGHHRTSWDTQFKFLPLYCRRWEWAHESVDRSASEDAGDIFALAEGDPRRELGCRRHALLHPPDAMAGGLDARA